MGDSITLGVPVNGGYRDPLYTLLTNRSDTFTLVGSQTGYATTALTDAGQTHHEGHSGYVITNGTGRAGLDENLASWIGPGALSPDRILLMIGSNDINLSYDMTNAPARLSNLVDHIYGYLPTVKLYLASIIPMSGHESDVQAFNAAIPGIVTNSRALGRDVVYVPMHDALDINTDLADGLHPNAQGYLHMAQAWDAALHVSTNLTVAIAGPANGQKFMVGTSVTATATVVNAVGAYTVQVYTNSGSGTFSEAGSGGSASPYEVSLGALPAGTYHLYATVTDTGSTATSATNTFTISEEITDIHAVDVTNTDGGSGLGGTYSVGWDFTVTQTIKVTSLGQFDPGGSATSNAVAIYRRAGAKLVEAAVLATSPAEQSGVYVARYAAIDGLVLTNGNYVVFSTQNGENFIAPNGSPTADFGAAITWNKGVANTNGSAYAPPPATAPATWPIENTNAFRYFGPTFKYDVVFPAPTPTLICPTNGQVFTVGESVSATATVSGASGAYAVHVYTASGSGAFSEAGAGGASSPYAVSLGALPAGTYRIYASATDTNATATTATNTFTVVTMPGQQILGLTGWNKDVIIGASETAPGYSVIMGGWNFYEKGLSGGTLGLPADVAATNRTFTSSRNPSVRFQFQPYTANNALYLDGPGSATLTLTSPAKFQSLQFLETTRTMSWYARLNFSDGSSATTRTWSDPDWTANPGPSDRCLMTYGLKSTSTFYTGYLWMAQRDYTLEVADQCKTLASITFVTTGASGYQLALFAVSGYVLDSLAGTNHAVTLTSAGDGAAGGTSFSVGWDFTVTQPIRITSLGQFDPNAVSKSNTVALYRRGGAKIAEAAVLTDSSSEQSGNYSARYAPVDALVLTNGNYVVVSTQNGDNFIAGGGSPAATFGPGVTWNKGVAMASGSAAGPLPDVAPATWFIENTSAFRYFGPTFAYELVVPPPTLTLVCPTNDQVLAAGDSLCASVTVARAVGDYTVHVYTNSGSDAFAEVGAGGSSSPYVPCLGMLSASGTYHVYATVTDAFSTTNTATNTFTVAVKIGQQMVGVTGWNQDLIIGKSEAAPGYSVNMGGWNFYERGLSNSTQGLPADAAGTNRMFTSSRSSAVKFRFAPYVGKNALFFTGASSAALTLVNPSKFYALQFLATTRSSVPPVRWYATLNFSDGSSAITDTWGDPDWTQSGASDTCLTSYGLRKATDNSFFSGYLWMASHGITLSAADREKTINSITFTSADSGDRHLAVFAVSGYAFGDTTNDFHAVDVLSPGSGPGGGNTYSVGWDFTVSETITVTSLGQFDPDSNPKTNAVALYQRAGEKLVEATVYPDSPAASSGICSARYAKVNKLILAPGNYVIVSTQNNDNFLAGSGTVDTSFGPAITWNKGIALASGSSAGPLPSVAPTNWPIENASASRYFGPTFKYELRAIYPEGTLIRIR